MVLRNNGFNEYDPFLNDFKKFDAGFIVGTGLGYRFELVEIFINYRFQFGVLNMDLDGSKLVKHNQARIISLGVLVNI